MEEALPASCVALAERWTGTEVAGTREAVAEEVPVALAYNGVSHAVMLATPCDLEDFAVGFSLSEGIVRARTEIRGVEAAASADGVTVDIAIGSGAFARLKERRRTLAGRTGCGLCGTESLAQVLRPLPRVTQAVAIDLGALRAAAAALQARQRLHTLTGAAHAAAWAAADGTLVSVREDIGRHNALDKLIGALARERASFADGFALLTSRASSEMVQKAATVGIPLLAAVSAPTSLAIRLAEQHGVTLVAWLRGNRLVVLAHGHRLRARSAEPVA